MAHVIVVKESDGFRLIKVGKILITKYIICHRSLVFRMPG